MSADWLLVETLGDQPLVVAEGRRLRSPAPLGLVLRRSPHLAAIQTAIAETVASGIGLASITPKSKRVIRTEPVQMTDGRIHAVHVWFGPTDEVPPERAIPGPLVWDLAAGDGSASGEYLANVGLDPTQDNSADRGVDDTARTVEARADGAGVHSWVADAEPDRTYCANWEFVDSMGSLRRVGWWARTLVEQGEDDRQHLVVRGMNLVEAINEVPGENSGGLEPQTTERMVIDAKTWDLLRWLDHPVSPGQRPVDAPTDSVPAAIRGSLRIPNDAGDAVLLHVSITSAELADGTVGAVVNVQQPADGEFPHDAGSPTN